MILFGLVQECMGLMMIVSGVLYGRSFQGCTLGGIRLGVFGDFNTIRFPSEIWL